MYHRFNRSAGYLDPESKSKWNRDGIEYASSRRKPTISFALSGWVSLLLIIDTICVFLIIHKFLTSTTPSLLSSVSSQFFSSSKKIHPGPPSFSTVTTEAENFLQMADVQSVSLLSPSASSVRDISLQQNTGQVSVDPALSPSRLALDTVDVVHKSGSELSSQAPSESSSTDSSRYVMDTAAAGIQQQTQVSSDSVSSPSNSASDVAVVDVVPASRSETSSQMPYQAPPSQMPYQAPPPQMIYQAPPPQMIYQAPPPQMPYQTPFQASVQASSGYGTNSALAGVQQPAQISFHSGSSPTKSATDTINVDVVPSSDSGLLSKSLAQAPGKVSSRPATDSTPAQITISEPSPSIESKLMPVSASTPSLNSHTGTIENAVDLSKCKFYGQEHKDAARLPDGSVQWKYTGRPDEHVFNLLYKEPLKRNGIFLEMGALDGKLYSNSLFFEECLQWKGLLIEAQELNYEKLLVNRPNPDVIKLRSAICEEPGFLDFVGKGAAAGAVESMTEQSKEHFSKHWGEYNKVQKVPCKPMRDILKENSIKEIDFFSLDVEGAEPIVLKTIDFDVVDIKFMLLENNIQCSQSTPTCDEILTQNGFYQAGTFSVNKLYLNKKFYPDIKLSSSQGPVIPVPVPATIPATILGPASAQLQTPALNAVSSEPSQPRTTSSLDSTATTIVAPVADATSVPATTLSSAVDQSKGIEQLVTIPWPDISKCKFYGQEHKDAVRLPNGSVQWKYTGRPDEHVFNLLYKEPLKRNGIFLEMGALDGKLYSNSLFFEECLQWKGLLIEAQELNYEKLLVNRPNPDVIKLRSAICEEPGFLDFVGKGAAAGAVESMTEQSKEHFSKHWGEYNKVQKVPCKPMRDILKENSIKEIDFFSLDVEGAEPIVLKTIDFDVVDIKFMLLENNIQCSQSTPTCDEILTQNGFYQAGTFSVNKLYLNKKFYPDIKLSSSQGPVIPVPVPATIPATILGPASAQLQTPALNAVSSEPSQPRTTSSLDSTATTIVAPVADATSVPATTLSSAVDQSKGIEQLVTIPWPDISKCKFYGQEHKDAVRLPDGSVQWKYTGRPDEHVFNLLYKEPLKRNGIFLEMGALDGKLYSNSLFFEECLQWKGLLIEAQELNYEKLLVNRPNPDVIKLRSAVCEEPGFLDFVGKGAAAGAVESMSEKSRAQFAKHWGEYNKIQQVPCKPMRDILKERNIREIDFFSLDVRGAEPIVLKTIDFDLVDIKFMLLEYNSQCSISKPSCDEILTKNGFYQIGSFSVNRLYLNKKFYPNGISK